jgi:hypothetical protein
MFEPLRAMLGEPETKVLVAAAIGTVLVGTVAYMLLEGWTFVEALYFCVVTLATVGYGDLHPTTDASRLFTIAYIIAGVGIFLAFITELAQQRSQHELARRAARRGADPSEPPPDNPEIGDGPA